MQTTQLAQCKISNADRLTIELVEPPDMPPVIPLRWPDEPSVCTPDGVRQHRSGCKCRSCPRPS